MLEGEKLAVRPDGNEAIEKAIAELNPPLSVVFNVILALLPWTRETADRFPLT